jgi:phospholipid/cholesterol/gamma-HCH transport system substrate-binding protein
MANQQKNNIRLGLFILTAAAALMIAFYMIGVNHSLFGSDFTVKARFAHSNGLTPGDNVLFSGIQAGTVKRISIVDDSTIEAELSLDNNIRSFIHKNSLVSIGTDGFIGNKIVNIIKGNGTSAKVDDGDLLPSRKMVDVDELMTTFSKTNTNAAIISETLKNTVQRVSESELVNLLNDRKISLLLEASLRHIDDVTANADKITRSMNAIAANMKNGKGAAGMFLSDTAFAGTLRQTMIDFKSAGNHINHVSSEADQLISLINKDVATGRGPVATLLQDTLVARNLALSMENVQKGTAGFSENMEALKHNWFLRGYFKRQEKQKKEEAEKRN